MKNNNDNPMIKTRLKSTIALLVSLQLLAACESDNEHFCARYQYVYEQLLEDDVPPYQEMRQQLLANRDNPNKDQAQARFMLFVLEDWRAELKLPQESAKEFCMRVKRWQFFQ